MKTEESANVLTRHLEDAEQAVRVIKDPRLREIAFGRILDHLLSDKRTPMPKGPSGLSSLQTGGNAEESVGPKKEKAGPKASIGSLVNNGAFNSPLALAEVANL